MSITIEDLAAADLISPNWLADRTPSWRALANAHLAGEPGRWWESDVTTFMSLGFGRLNTAMTKSLCAVAGVEVQAGFGLISGHDFAKYAPGRKGRRTIDLVVATGWERRGDEYVAHVGIEAKFNAAVNGDSDFCVGKHHHLGYSNQIICYPAGCTHDALDVASSIPFVWLSNDDRGVKRGLSARDVEKYPHLDGAYTAQQESVGLWAPTTWSALRANTATDLAAEGLPSDVLTAVKRALTPESISRR